MGLAQSILFSLSHNEETLNNAMYIVIIFFFISIQTETLRLKVQDHNLTCSAKKMHDELLNGP